MGISEAQSSLERAAKEVYRVFSFFSFFCLCGPCWYGMNIKSQKIDPRFPIRFAVHVGFRWWWGARVWDA